MILLITCAILFILYTILIFYYWYGWDACPEFKGGATNKITRISVIVPARNEEKNIGNLLEILQQQTYTNYEVIVVDDQSEDRTAEFVKKFPGVKLLQLSEHSATAHKKFAVSSAIAMAEGELIVCTDADCEPRNEWLSTIAAFYEEKKGKFIAGPVTIDCDPSVLQIFQAMDFLVLQGITGAAIHKRFHLLCNGANLSYEKRVFNEVDGFTGIDHIASGDDMLLMSKVKKKYPDDIYYLKSKHAIVTTQAEKSWGAFFNQRLRWSGKAMHYDDTNTFLVLLLVYLYNLSFVVLLVMGFWKWELWIALLGSWILKNQAEAPFMRSVSRFFGKEWMVKYLFFFQPLHIGYTVVVGLLGQFVKYKWKGRSV